MRLVRLSLCLLPLALACNPSGVEEASGEVEDPDVTQDIEEADEATVDDIIEQITEAACLLPELGASERRDHESIQPLWSTFMGLFETMNPDEKAAIQPRAAAALSCGEEAPPQEPEENTDEGEGGDEVDGEENAEATGNEDAETTGDPSDGE